MNRLQGISKGVLVIFLLGNFSFLLVGQEMSKNELEEHAAAMYKAQCYDKACIDYQKLYDLYPKEVKYNYVYGKSLLMANKSISKAIDLLKYTASRNTYTDVHYYLALAYYHAYMFDEAEIALGNFINYSSRKDRKKLNPEELNNNITIAREELQKVKGYDLISKMKLKDFQLEAAYANHISGRFGVMPESFQSEGDKLHSHKGVMYFPEESVNGTKIFISSYETKRSKQVDLFLIEQVTALNYTLPKILDNINSSSNEVCPFFDQKNNVLYFSSDRPGGLGGFDIYKSKYDSSKNSFSSPQRLEFPINSAYDDYLYVPDSANKVVVFLSNRESFGENIIAYSISCDSQIDFVSPEDSSDFNKLAYFQYKPYKVEEKSEQKDINLILPVKQQPQTEYDILIGQALNKQLYCDSLRTQLKVVEEQLKVETDKEKRKLLFSKMASVKRDITSTQNSVDEIFAEARKLKPDEKHHDNENDYSSDDALSKQEINGIIVYTFDSDKKESKTNSEQTIEKEAVKKNIEKQFQILLESPYSIDTPIPLIKDLPEGLVYRIQLGVFGSELPMNAFGGLTPLSYEVLSDRKLTKYYVGYFSTSKEARQALEEVIKYGYKDAFIVPYFNNKKVSIEEAREREFGDAL